MRHTGLLLGMQLLLMALAGGAAASGDDEAPATVDMTVRQVSEHVYYVEGESGPATGSNQGFVANAGFIVTGAGVVVFDALGSPALARLLLEKIHGITDEPVVRVVVSHYHADHIYGLQVFAGLDAEILAPDGADEYLDSDQAAQRLEERRNTLAPWVNENTHLISPDQYLGEGTRFRLGDVEFIITLLGAAHSDGDLAMYVGPDRVLFSGDVVFNELVPFLGDADTRHWLKVLERMDREKLTALVPGHGPMVQRSAQGHRLHAPLPGVPAQDDGSGCAGACRLRRSLRGCGLERVRYAAGLYRGEPAQRLPGLPLDGSGNAAREIVARKLELKLTANTQRSSLMKTIKGASNYSI